LLSLNGKLIQTAAKLPASPSVSAPTRSAIQGNGIPEFVLQILFFCPEIPWFLEHLPRSFLLTRVRAHLTECFSQLGTEQKWFIQDLFYFTSRTPSPGRSHVLLKLVQNTKSTTITSILLKFVLFASPKINHFLS
jgi:hypothetical protein